MITYDMLDELEKKVYKKRTIILLCLDSIIIVISKVLELNSIFYCFILALVSLSLMLILGSLKNKQMIWYILSIKKEVSIIIEWFLFLSILLKWSINLLWVTI